MVVRGAEIACYGDPPAARHATPLRQGGEVLGELIVGLRPGGRIDPGDARLGPGQRPDSGGRPGGCTRRAAPFLPGAGDHRPGGGAPATRRDLHDGLGRCSLAVLNAEAALRRLDHDPARTADLLVELRDQATGALEDIRRLVYDLRPPALDSLGLVEALRAARPCLERENDAPLRVSVEAPTPLPELPAAVEVAAYRIVTEALTNVVRHSSASAAVVRLTVSAGTPDLGARRRDQPRCRLAGRRRADLDSGAGR